MSRTVVKGRKGRSLRVDIHCHYLNPEVAAKVAHLNPGAVRAVGAASPTRMTREVNVKQMKDRAPMLSTIEVRLKDMDRMGIDIQAVSPAPNQTYYWTEPGMGAELARAVNERHRARSSRHGPTASSALGTVPLQDAELAVAELEFAA